MSARSFICLSILFVSWSRLCMVLGSYLRFMDERSNWFECQLPSFFIFHHVNPRSILIAHALHRLDTYNQTIGVVPVEQMGTLTQYLYRNMRDPDRSYQLVQAITLRMVTSRWKRSPSIYNSVQGVLWEYWVDFRPRLKCTASQRSEPSGTCSGCSATESWNFL